MNHLHKICRNSQGVWVYSRFTAVNSNNHNYCRNGRHAFHKSQCNLQSSISKGQDLLADSLSFGSKPKIILDSFYPDTGIDVHGMLRFLGPTLDTTEQVNTLLMNGSVIVFPHSCYLWKPSSAKEVTLESLSMIVLCKPSVEFLFIGCDSPLPPRELNRIKKEMKKKHIVVEQMDVMNAMGTFNVLNGEDRRIAVAIVVPTAE